MMTNSCVNTPEESGFYLKLNYSQREKSKDSNSQNTTLIIKNRIIEYSVTHAGRDPRPDITKEYKLSKDAENQLIEFIKKNELNQNIDEHIADVSPGINTTLLLEITMDNISTKATIAGAVNAWGSKEYLKKQNTKTIKNKVYYGKINSLLNFLKSKLGFKEIEI